MKFTIDDKVRDRHIYIAGKTRHGKSTLMHWMALQDIARGKGVAVLDPKGDLVEKLIHFIPKSRVADTIYLDGMTPIPIDFMSWKGERERDMLADDLFVTFRRFSETWGERMDAILRHALNTLLTVEGTTFLDIYYFLADNEYRKKILGKVRNRDLLLYWEKQFPHLPKDATSPILSRMSKFILTPSLKGMLGSQNAKLNIFDLMETRKVLLVNLAKVGKESGNLLGTLLVSKFQQAAMRRQYQKPKDRIPFYFYTDEFQNFQTSAFDVILSEAGGFKLCLTLAHQYVDQLETKIRASIFGNVSTMILFRLGQKDAHLFKGEIDEDYIAYLPTLVPGRAIYRDANAHTTLIKTPTPPEYSRASYAEIIRKRTIEPYSCEPPKDALLLKDEEVKPAGRPKRAKHGQHEADSRVQSNETAAGDSVAAR